MIKGVQTRLLGGKQGQGVMIKGFQTRVLWGKRSGGYDQGVPNKAPGGRCNMVVSLLHSGLQVNTHLEYE